MHSSPLIEARNVNVWYNGLHALSNVNMDIHEHKITAMIGASGSGKSTFLRSINRMLDTVPLARVDGQILLQGQNVLEPETDVIHLRRSVGMVFQNPTPFPQSIYDNIAYGLEIQGHKKTRKSGFLRRRRIDPVELEQSTDSIDRAVVQSLKEAALWDEVKDRLHQSALSLSGGQQQRLCIARAIAVRPLVLLLDEPCSQLDPLSTHKIEELLLVLKKSFTIVIVTHNMHQARRIADHISFFHLGTLIEHASAQDIFESPKEALTREYVSGNFG
ncbi:MAG: phosphate ABC transporter ATP-binding protein [Candidatus Peribacteraceae bacterium]|nr:phosphate ABC transporter ATP-binding protein [Candidatus Peribacteraceae bacterium]